MSGLLTLLGLIVGFILLCVAIYKIIKHHGNARILKMFRSGNVLVAGHKGRGKDLLFQYVIAARERDGERHAANITYTKKTHKRPISYYSLSNNSRKNFISGDYETETHTFVEREDYYISDAGVALPAHAHNELEKRYPTLPIVYALSRHLGDFNIHANSQEFCRVWDKLREQADYFIYQEGAKVIGRYAFIRFVTYDNLSSAMAHRQPYTVRRTPILRRANKYDLAHAHTFNAQYGTIIRDWLWYKLPREHYETRAFYRLLYKQAPPDIDKANKKRKNAKK